MLWVALHFPQLQQQAIARGHASPEPGCAALQAVAAWAGRFTPRVSLEPPEALALEVAGSLRYFGGARRLLSELRAGLEALGFEARSALAPTARAALWRAAGGGGALEELSTAVLRLPPDAAALLADLGARRLGEVLALPREGLARRFGEALLRQLDEARGARPEARDFFTPPARFHSRLVLPAEVVHADRLLFAANRLLLELEGFLTARQAGVRRLDFTLEHEDRAHRTLPLGLAGAAREAKHFAQLLRERLAREPLAAPVTALVLLARDLEPLAPEKRALFAGRQGGAEAWLRLVERLQARLGHEAVHGLGLREDHRPERAWRAVEPVESGKKAPGEKAAAKERSPNKPRPVWLLESPRPLREGRFDLLAGPERIESGWWDGEEARRDYFIARLLSARGERQSLAWVYRERGEKGGEGGGGWFVHGLFA